MLRHSAVPAVLCAFAIIVVQPSCKRDEKKPPTDSTSAPTSSSEEGELPTLRPVESQPAASESNAGVIASGQPASQGAPTLQMVGAPGHIPERIEVIFSQSVRPGNGSTQGTELHVRPKLKGSLRWMAQDRLSFTPETGFAPDTLYEVDLVKVAGRDEPLTPPKDAPWRLAYRTPELKLLGVDFDRKAKRFSIRASAPLDERSLADAVRVRFDTRSVAPEELQWSSGGKTLTVNASETAAKSLTIDVAAGVRTKSGNYRSKKSYSRTFLLKSAGAAKLTRPYIQEGANGFYIEVSCREKLPSYKYERSCRVREEELPDYVFVSPAVPITFSATSYGFRIIGDFRYGNLQVVVQSGLVTERGSVVERTLEQTLNVPRRKPKLNFVGQGRYVPRSKLNRVPLSHVNLTKAHLEVRQIHKDNTTYWLSGRVDSPPNQEMEEMGYYTPQKKATERPDDRISDVLLEQNVELPRQFDVKMISVLDLESVLPKDAEGIFEFRVHHGDMRYGGGTEAAIRVVVTDLAMVTKRLGDPKKPDLRTWVLNNQTLDPVRGAKLTARTFSNRVLATCTTDSSGACTMENVVDSSFGKPAFVITAETKDDFTFLQFSDLEVALGDSDVQGRPFVGEAAYSAALYSDRGVYRPGETAHITALIRDSQDRGPSELPLLGKVTDPQGRLLRKLRVKTNEVGFAAFDQRFSDFATTGRYRFDLEIGGSTVETYYFNVEEFVPERMKVKATAGAENLSSADKPIFDIDAVYLFGSIPKGASTTLTCSIRSSTFSSTEFKGYRFGPVPDPDSPPIAIDLGTTSGNLDSEGKAQLACPELKNHALPTAPAKLHAMASVMEAGSGRASIDNAAVPFHPDDFYIGLHGPEEVDSGATATVKGVLTDWDGKLNERDRDVTVTVFQVRYEWNYERVGGRQRWVRHLRRVRQSKDTVRTQGGKFSIDFTQQGWSRGMVVVARSGNTVTEFPVAVNQQYYWWGDYSRSGDITPRPEQPTGMRVEAPSEIRSGESFVAKFQTPFKGRMLVTVETNDVLEERWVTVSDELTEVPLSIGGRTPNAYVSGLLLKDPALESDDAYMPGRAFGVRSVRITPEEQTLDLTVSTPTEVKPNSKLTVDIAVKDTDGPVYATVAAVDEGILRLTRFQSPDMLKSLYGQRALGIATYETVGWSLMLPPQDSGKSPGGGDGGPQGRMAPVKPVALWSGFVKVENGRAKVDFDVPTYRGELRVMVSAASARQTRSASKSVTVRDPLVLQTTLPRFLVHQDRFVIPVHVTNLTGKAGNVTLTVTHGDSIEIAGKSSKVVNLDPDESETATFVGRTTAQTGGVKLKVEAKGLGHTSHDSLQVPILPNAPFAQEVKRVQISKAKTDLKSSLSSWAPGTEQATVWVTSNPYGEEFQHLRYLVRYPYGCIEQTTSGTRPLLYVSNLLKSVDPEWLGNANVADKFMHGVNRLLSMQTSSGGFSYWPGATTPTYWGTAYVTHVMLEGRDAGYPIPPERLEDALTFMERTLSDGLGGTDAKYGYSVAQSEPYMQYVLAKAGRGRKGRLQKLLKNHADWKELEDENLFLIRAALHLSGDRTHEDALKSAGAKAIGDGRTNGWTFWSSLRTRGMQLAILEELFPGDGASEGLAQNIASRLRGKTSRSLTTQEISWTVSALGKRSEGIAGSWSGGSLVLGGKPQKPLPNENPKNQDLTWMVTGLSQYGSASLSLDGFSTDRSAFAVVSTQGIKPDAKFEYGDESLRVRRSYVDSDGNRVSPDSLALGDTVYVRVSLENLSNERIQNVAVVDRFSAGFEIENPRLGRSQANNILSGTAWEVEHMNIRDDRIELFGHLPARKTVEAVYVLRAVTAGKFTTPPIKAEAMYEPKQWSRSKGSQVWVADPWGAM